MRFIKRILVFALLLLLLAATGIVLFLGPWPLYRDSHYQQSRYFRDALANIDAAAALTHLDAAPGPLRAGWAARDLTTAPGHPLAGYGGRANDKKCTGIHDHVFVRALALNDGADTVVLIGSDLLQTLPNMLELIEAKIAPRTGLSNRNILYTSSHTHGGPGGFAPGIIAKEAFGEYSPEFLAKLTDAFAEAIIEAVDTMAPARFAHTAIDAPEYIRNRCREGAPVDSTLHVAIAEKLSGERLYLARYSAHGTAFGEEFMEMNGDFASAFQRAVQAKTGAPLLYLGGAVGSMRPIPPGPPMPAPRTRDEAMGFENDVEANLVREGKKTLADLVSDQTARVEAMGAALAEKVVAAAVALQFSEHLDIASLDAPYTPPPAQVRILSPTFRLSPYLFGLLGVPTTGRLQAARIGNMLLVGLPYDVCGELSREWQALAAKDGTALWVTSFSGAYLGYLSPDQYYWQIGPDYGYNQNYELAEMGWFGPNQVAFVQDLVLHTVQALTPPAGTIPLVPETAAP